MPRWSRRRRTGPPSHDAPGRTSAPPDEQPLDPSAEGPVAAPAPGRVVIVTRRGCHLCEEAVATARKVMAAQDGPEPVLVDVDTDPQLRGRWGDHVPVTFVDARLVAYWHLDPQTLRRSLDGDPPQLPVHP